VKNRTGLERYWQVARYPENIDVLAGYGPFEVLDADQEERVEGVGPSISTDGRVVQR
jgi:hypothetical protein